ncbi:glycosyltransferase [Mucilaginibacter sp. PAMB04274]|uniref:glycosyltransferase n=1 Tax=Mucilaginibacter sp. PAMB04274 TaxID=3138568 RepID=UPI0031F71D41
MISVIISSANQKLLADVRVNIAETVGVPFEILAFDNSTGAKGMCQIYNEGVAQAKYDILCFMHEDVSIKTARWGEVVNRLFQENPAVGLIGVAGSSYKPLSPSGWQGVGGDRTDYLNVLQSYKYNKLAAEHTYRNPRNEKLTEVVSVDGVWFCTTRTVLAKARFDEDTFTGFHKYDLDFSMQVRQHYQVVVTYDVLMEHFSEGSLSKEWVFETAKFNAKWINQLPAYTEELTAKQKFVIEKQTFRAYIAYLIKYKLPASLAYRELFRNLRYLKVYPSLFFKNLAFVGKAYKVAKKEGRL